MAKVSLLFLTMCMVCALDQTLGNGYYYPNYFPSYPDTADLYNFGPYSAILQPDCDKDKEGEGSSSTEESKEGGSSEEGKSSSEEGKESSSSEEKGSKEEKKEGSEEEKKGESEEIKEGEKKEAPKKKKLEYVFPPRAYTFPARQMQQIVYSSATPYNYLPYSSSYVVQQPASSYPVRTNYQYLTLPSAAKPYAVSSPVSRIVYSPGVNYPAVSKTLLAPGANVYSAPTSWNSPVSYYYK